MKSVSLKATTFLVAVLLLITVCIRSGYSDSTEKKSTQAEQETIAIAFATEHHPELANLLKQLKDMDRKGYDAAVLDLFRTRERMAKYEDRTADRYATELALWKIDSRIRLLAAQSANGMDDTTREQIRDLLLERNHVRLTQYEVERDRMQARLKKVNDSIKDLKSKSTELADRDLDRLVKTVKSRKPVTKSKSP